MGNGLGVFSPWIYGQGKGRKEGLNVSSTSPSHRISIYFSYILRPPLEGRALHSQECFLPPRGGFNLRCTRERYIPKNVSIRGVQILRSYDAPSLPRKDNRFDQELTSAGGESATYFTEPPDFHIFLRYPPLQIWSLHSPF